MRDLARLGAGLTGVGAFAVCCALGPGAILAGLGAPAAGLGLGAWIAVAAGILIACAGALLALARRRVPAACQRRVLAPRSAREDPSMSSRFDAAVIGAGPPPERAAQSGGATWTRSTADASVRGP